MNTRLASVAAAALALSLAAPVSASAQALSAPAGAGISAVEGGPSWQPRRVDRYDWQRRGIDSSAKGGNDSQPERLVPQYGNTSGGPAY